MLGAAVLAEVEIPPIVLLGESELCHTGRENVHSLLTLGSADDLADTGNEEGHFRAELTDVLNYIQLYGTAQALPVLSTLESHPDKAVARKVANTISEIQRRQSAAQ